MIIYWISGGIYLMLFTITIVMSWRARGKLGFQEYCASSSMARIQLVLAIVLIVFALVSYNAVGVFNFGSLFLAAVLVYYGLDKLRIGANGVYIEGVFIGWDEIENYNWSVDNPKVLMLHLKRRRPALAWRKSIKWKAVLENKSQISSLLRQYGKQSLY